MSQDSVDELVHGVKKMGKPTFLGLPNEIISKIFTYLDVPSRLKFRVNRRLNQIEKETEFYVPKITIVHTSLIFETMAYVDFSGPNDDFIKLYELGRIPKLFNIVGNKRESFIRCLSKMAKNTFFEKIEFRMNGTQMYYPLTVAVSLLTSNFLEFEEGVNDKTILGLVRYKKNAKLVNIRISSRFNSPDAVVDVYKKMVDRSIKLESLSLSLSEIEWTDKFLNLIGIRGSGKKWRSNVNVELFYDTSNKDKHKLIILDGVYRISIKYGSSNRKFEIEKYENNDELRRWKEIVEKIDVLIM
ncbi:hypothetical protein PFISCL1PPCAC_19210 [Pristionchus fissidentatus]|uniref:F-box domain-containing protein n=1 Tax=Pristionchus fissidentatus TaxID=1538716 RepID=A0AAV5WC03_9BILA|nr:hypothetical protein PFISCL1PPCAC_19210 [Pristionchus fissidentatus]